jgi:hypothetical protein
MPERNLRGYRVNPLSRVRLRPTAAACATLFFIASVPLLNAQSVTNTIRSDATWRATGNAPLSGWNSSIGFNDSDSAGWEFAFKSPAGTNIWLGSNLSAEAPDEAWFRYVFYLPGDAISAEARFSFDDNGEAYVNGILVLTDTPTSPTVTFQLDPRLFRAGANVVAVHGIDTQSPFNNIGVTMTVVTVPEPCATLLLSVSGSLLLGRSRRLRCSA